METKYNRRTWLNKEDSPSTGNVVCFDGDTTNNGIVARNMFVSISGCYNSARLHLTEDDTIEDFTRKLTVLRDELGSFINHLKKDNGFNEISRIEIKEE